MGSSSQLPSPGNTLNPSLCGETSGLQRGPRPNTPSVFSGNEDSTFSISVDSGNLTMTKSIPNAKTFLLVVKVGACTRPCLGPQLQNMQFKDQLVTVVSQTLRASRLIMPDTP